MMRLSMPTVHIMDRFGRNDAGFMKKENLILSVQQLVKIGAHDIELYLETFNYFKDQFDDSILTQLIKLKEKHNLRFTAHLPFKYSDISSLDDGIREVAVRNILQTIKSAAGLGVEAFTIHVLGYVAARVQGTAGSTRITKEVVNSIIDDMLGQSEKSLRSICEHVESSKIAVENLPYASIDKIFAIADRNKCAYCLDLGKAAITGDDPSEILKKALSKVRVIHLHDAAKKNDGAIVDHQPLGAGIVPIRKVLETCKEIDYLGVVVLEILNEEWLLDGLRYLETAGLTDDKMTFLL